MNTDNLYEQVIITEHRKNNKTTEYKAEYFINDSLEKEVSICYSVTETTVDNIPCIFLYDSEKVPQKSSYDFLNVHMESYSYNSRRVAANALRLLYSFETILGKKLAAFNHQEIVELKYFLRGGTYEGTMYHLRNLQKRRADTVNHCLSIYRNYLKFLRQKNDHLTEKTFLKGAYTHGEYYHTHEKFSSSLPTVYKGYEVPKYLTRDNFKDIIHYLRNEKTNWKRNESIFRLMYFSGLRIGECLGLTLEDLIVTTTASNNVLYHVCIRNRATDKPSQCAKLCMNINKRDTAYFTRSEYNEEKYGYEYQEITKETYELIMSYITTEREEIAKAFFKRYAEKSIADAVSEDYRTLKKANYYLFLNSKGSPLLGDTWNNVVRKVYKAVGIITDTGKRENNLNHRCRHSFAMNCVANERLSGVALAKAMRHRAIESGLRYYNPTIDEKIRSKELAVAHLIKNSGITTNKKGKKQ